MRRISPLLLLFVFLGAIPCRADLSVAFHSATDIPVTSDGFTAAGRTFSATLHFAPPVGTSLTVVKNTGVPWIVGEFANLAQGQAVMLSHNGVRYPFIANYYGGTGNDLVLQWAKTQASSWGDNGFGQLGDGSSTDRLQPVKMIDTGFFAGKTVVSAVPGTRYSLILCSDGTLAISGSTSTVSSSQPNSLVPVAVIPLGPLADKKVVAITGTSVGHLALCSDGSLAFFGTVGGSFSNIFRAVPKEGALSGKSVVGIATGPGFCLALCSDGSIAAWGTSNSSGQQGSDDTVDHPVPVEVNRLGVLAGKTPIAVAAGTSFSLALLSDGRVASWGANGSGQLGNGQITNSQVPVLVDAGGVLLGKTVVAVAAGNTHCLALCADGTLAAWGSNDSGQLGNNSTTASSVPVAVDQTGVLAGKTIVRIAAGRTHSMALCSDGTLAAWGANAEGQLGINSTTNRLVPTAVNRGALSPADAWVGIFSSAAADCSLAVVGNVPSPTVAAAPATKFFPTQVTLNGSVHPYGNTTTAFFEYGVDTNYGSSAHVTLSPADGYGTQNISVTLSSLTTSTLYHYRLTAVSAFGTVSTVNGTFTPPVNIPFAYHSPADVPVVANGFTATDKMFSPTLHFAPAPGTNLMVVKNTALEPIAGTLTETLQGQVVTLNHDGAAYRFAVNYQGGDGNDLVLQWAQNRLLGWGQDERGQLGDSGMFFHRFPVSQKMGTLGGKTVVAVAGGQTHSVILTMDGTLFASGNMSEVSGTSNSLPTPLTGGALTGKRVISVAAGGLHSLALCSDGTVASWGTNSSGQLGNNSFTSGSARVAVSTSGVLAGKTVVAIAAGESHSLALCSDGTLAAWGSNTAGQLGNNSTAGSSVPVAVNMAGVLAGKTVIMVAAGGAHNLALCSDGTLVSWGAGASGQLGNGGTAGSLVPVSVVKGAALSDKTIVAISAGEKHNLVLCSDGSVAVWGDNSGGQLGNGTVVSSPLPITLPVNVVLAGKTIVSLTAGRQHSVAVCSDGTIATWGKNNFGQLGNAQSEDSPVPVAIDTIRLGVGEKFVAVFSGPLADHTLGLSALPPGPMALTRSGSLVPYTSALTGEVNAFGSSASVAFEFGTTPALGTVVAADLPVVTGHADVRVDSVGLFLLPNTDYYYRLRATADGITNYGSTYMITIRPDQAAPSGGTMILLPDVHVAPGGMLSVSFANWADHAQPLSYAVLVDDLVVSATGPEAVRSFAAPTAAGPHVLKGRIADAFGNIREVTLNFTVVTIPDSWRMLYFNTTQNAGAAADLADADGDGAHNFLEYVTGLDPTNATSRFGVEVQTVAGQPNRKAVVFGPVIGGRTYVVKYKASLTDPGWSVLPNFTTSDNGSQRTVIDLSAGNSLRFYRVEVALP